jgi:hypothetical protein
MGHLRLWLRSGDRSKFRSKPPITSCAFEQPSAGRIAESFFGVNGSVAAIDRASIFYLCR